MTSFILQKFSHAKKQGPLSKGTVGAMVMSAASLGLNILQEMNEPVFQMKFESLPPASKISYRLVLLSTPPKVLSMMFYFSQYSPFFQDNE